MVEKLIQIMTIENYHDMGLNYSAIRSSASTYLLIIQIRRKCSVKVCFPFHRIRIQQETLLSPLTHADITLRENRHLINRINPDKEINIKAKARYKHETQCGSSCRLIFHESRAII